MAKFCPYCGKQLSERSKFCPHCGKAPPRRAPGVLVEDAPRPSRGSAGNQAASTQAAADDANGGTPSLTNGPANAFERPVISTHGETDVARASKIEAARARAAVDSAARARAARTTVGRSSHGFAPPTHALIGSLEQAGFGLRYGAWMFDFLITMIAIMAFTFIMTAVTKQSVVGSNKDLLIVASLTALLFVLNFVVLAGRGGQSAGMLILGIRIARVDARPFTIKDAALRHLVGYPLSVAGLFLGFLWMLWDPRQQGWHDKIARTIVVMSR